MKGKRFFAKRNVVIGLVATALIAASATGVTIFLKDDGEASAAEQQNIPAISGESNLPVTGNEVNNDNMAGENPIQPNEPGSSGDESTTDEQGTTTGGRTPSTEEIIAGIEETIVMEDRQILDELTLSWSTIALSAVTTDMGIYKPELSIEKTATSIVKAGEVIDILENEKVPMVRPGDEIIYTIKVANSGNYKATNVVITDSLDVIFEGQKIDAGDNLAKIEVLEAGKVAILKTAYEVTQEDIDNIEIIDDVKVYKNIKNIAYATDGKTTVEDEDETVPVNPDIENITGTKIWIDNNNEYKTRPETITVNLLADGIEVAEIEVKPDANGEWKYEFTNLPKFNDDKEEIVYTITEDELENYTYEVSEEGYDLINTIKQDKTSVSGTKTWIAPEGTQYPSITINLLRDGKEVDSKELENGTTTYTFENLDKYDLTDGHIYEYTVTENEVEGYTSVQNGTNFTNTIEQDKTSVSGTKTWIAPEGTQYPSITINLLRDGKEVDSKELANGTTTYTFENLDKYDLTDGHIYEYTVSEEPVTGYTSVQNGNNFINTIEQDKTSVSGSKTWIAPEGTQYPTITINLLRDGKEVDSKELANGTTTYTFENLDKYDLTDGHIYEYTVTENEVEGYTSVQEGNNFINTVDQKYVSINGQKTWLVLEGTTIPDITIQLKKNGELVEGMIQQLTNGTKIYGFNDLPKYDYVLDESGNIENVILNEYEVEEVVVPAGYNVEYGKITETVDGNYVQNITNELITVDIQVEKEWVGDNESVRPTSIQVQLLADSETLSGKTVTLTAENEWKYCFEKLPKYKEGTNTEINYTVAEVEVPAGYISTVNGTTITNTFINATKNADKTTVEIGDKITYTITLTNEGDKDATVKLADTVPIGTAISGDIVMAGEVISVEEMIAGKDVIVPANDSVSLSFTVTVLNEAIGTVISNTATYNGTLKTETITTTTKKTISIYEIVEQEPQTVVIIIDTSLSMASGVETTDSDAMPNTYAETRWKALKDSLDGFIDTFLNNPNNKVAIVTYNESAYELTDFTGSKNVAKAAYANIFTEEHFNTTMNRVKNGNKNDRNWIKTSGFIDVDAIPEYTNSTLHSGTNITSGMTLANSKLANNTTNTSVILMTDGEDNRSTSSGTQTQAKQIIQKGAKIYTIAFTSDAEDLTKWVGSNNVENSYTSETSGSLAEAFGDIGNKLDPVTPETKTSNSEGVVDLSDYTDILDEAIVNIYVGDEKTTESIITTYTGKQFKEIIPNFNLKQFMNNYADKIPEGASINIEVITTK